MTFRFMQSACAFAVTSTLLLASGGSGSGGGTGGGGKTTTPPPAPNAAEVRISSELAPAGGTVQVKFSLTNPQPIMSGGTKVSAMQLNGVSLWSPLGDAAGAGVLKDGQLQIAAVSPAASLGTSTDYPFLTVTMGVPAEWTAGTTFPLTMDASTSLLSANGALAVTVKPGVLTVGGNFSIHGVTPGGGTYPAGTTIRIDGNGFLPGAQFRPKAIRFSSYRVVSATEIDFTLQEQTTLDGQMIQVINPGGYTQTYYSYLRGVALRNPSRAFLNTVEPIFQQQTHAIASTSTLPAQSAGIYAALALQNPNPGPAVATLNLTHADGSLSTATVLLASGNKLVDDLAAILGIPSILQGDQLNVLCTAPIQMLGLAVDENAGTVTPFLPAF